MRIIIALSVLVFSVVASAAPAQLFFYENPNNIKKPSAVSTMAHPQAATWLISGAGSCYKGSAHEVIEIIETMLFENNPLNIIRLAGYEIVKDPKFGGKRLMIQNLKFKWKEGKRIYTLRYKKLRSC